MSTGVQGRGERPTRGDIRDGFVMHAAFVAYLRDIPEGSISHAQGDIQKSSCPWSWNVGIKY